MNETKVVEYLGNIFHLETSVGENGNYEISSNYWDLKFDVRVRKFTIFIQNGLGAKCSIDSDEDENTIAREIVGFVGDVLKDASKTFVYDGTNSILSWPYNCNLAYVDYLKQAMDMGADENLYEYEARKSGLNSSKKQIKSSNDNSKLYTVEEFVDLISADYYDKEDFIDWVKEGIHGHDKLSTNRWMEQWRERESMFTNSEDSTNEDEFIVYTDDKEITVRKEDDNKWHGSDGKTFMGYLKPQDVLHWYRQDYGKAWINSSKQIKSAQSYFGKYYKRPYKWPTVPEQYKDAYEWFFAKAADGSLWKDNGDFVDNPFNPDSDSVTQMVGYDEWEKAERDFMKSRKIVHDIEESYKTDFFNLDEFKEMYNKYNLDEVLQDKGKVLEALNMNIKSAYTRPDSERFDEYGYFNPYTPTADELLKTDEIKKVLSEELSKAYEPDPMDKYTGIDTTNERIDTVIEEVAKQFNVDTDFVDQIAGEVQNETNEMNFKEWEWVNTPGNLTSEQYDQYMNGELDVRPLMLKNSHQIKSGWFRYTVEINTNDGNVYREDYEGANRSEIRKDIEEDFPNMKNFTILDYEDLSACYSSRRIKLSKEK